MIKSMTGFGRAEYSDEKRRITVEIKAVNHRYLDCSIKMPKKLSFFEASIRTLLKDYIQRGKVDVFITYEDYTENNLNLKYNRDMARAYYSYLKEMAEEFGIENDVRVSTLSRYPEVFSLEDADVDEEEIWSDLDKVIREAATHFVDARITEGENLKRDLCDKLDTMLTYVADIEKRAPQIIEEYKASLCEKVADLLADSKIDETRILGEVTIYADKICVDEEIVYSVFLSFPRFACGCGNRQRIIIVLLQKFFYYGSFSRTRKAGENDKNAAFTHIMLLYMSVAH